MLKSEKEEQMEAHEEDFKARVFAADPERFFKLFPTEDELEIEERLPESQEEFEEMMSELRALGHIN